MLNDIQIPPDEFVSRDGLRRLAQGLATVGAARAPGHVRCRTETPRRPKVFERSAAKPAPRAVSIVVADEFDQVAGIRVWLVDRPRACASTTQQCAAEAIDGCGADHPVTYPRRVYRILVRLRLLGTSIAHVVFKV